MIPFGIDLQAQLADAMKNSFVSGGLVLMALGAVLAWARNAPALAWRWILSRFTVSVEISNNDVLFEWMTLWLDEHEYGKRARRLTATTAAASEYSSGPGAVASSDSRGEPMRRILFTPAPGPHVFLYGRRLVLLERNRAEPSSGTGEGSRYMIPRETITVRMMGRDQHVARQLLDDARAIAEAQQKVEPMVYTAHYESWHSRAPLPPRALDSVVLPDGMGRRILDDIQTFRGRRQWYRDRGIPWRRGYLLEGTPGSGKTSLVTALASELRMSVCSLNLSSIGSDSALAHLIGTMRADSMLLIEDIDAAMPGRQQSKGGEDEKRDGITLAGLLNVLDGLIARDGTILFMTTNYKDRLDPALIRPGRADVHVEFGPATPAQAAGIFLRFFPGAEPEAEQFAIASVDRWALPMAALQQHLLVHSAGPHEALVAAAELAKMAIAEAAAMELAS